MSTVKEVLKENGYTVRKIDGVYTATRKPGRKPMNPKDKKVTFNIVVSPEVAEFLRSLTNRSSYVNNLIEKDMNK